LNFHEEIVDFKFGSDALIVLTRRGEVYKLGKNLLSSSNTSENFQKITEFEGPIKQIFSGTTCFFAIS
jgi:alpha-tubulin suppressor-like RCC1 family protein